jgi:arylsulfatase A-like enzyme
MTNIAVVVLDTVRKDVFDRHFDWLPGVHYEQAWSPSHYTVPVHAAMFTGKYASELGVHAKSETLDCPEHTIAERLHQSGYRTRAFSANALLASRNDFDRGFNVFEEGWRVRATDPELFNWSAALNADDVSHGVFKYPRAVAQCLLSDAPTIDSLKLGYNLKYAKNEGVDTAIKLTKNWSFGDDEFLFMNLMEAHAPYEPPEKYRTVDISSESPNPQTVLGGDANYSTYWQAYEDSVNYLSNCYREIFSELKEEFDYIFTLSDHGELFGEYGVYGHFYGLFPELTHVPLCLYDGSETQTHSHELVSPIDIHQTILEMANLSAPSSGKDIRDDIGERTLLSEYHGLRGARITRLENDGFSAEEISKYDQPMNAIALSPNYYGYENINEFQHQGTARKSDPRKQLTDMVSCLNKRAVDTDSDEEISENVKEQLERLGYA